uniref:Glycine N-acyltransferase-like protein n=1 Tax=Scophthalmus maximus TaxID=52904 RepID=A0A8D3D2Z4_SCOMX
MFHSLLNDTMELTGEQLKIAETHCFIFTVYGHLVLINRVRSDPVKVVVDKWPDFTVLVCKPQHEQKGDLFKDTLVFAKDDAILEKTIWKSSVLDWTRYFCLGNSNKAFLSSLCPFLSKKMCNKLAVCHMVMLEDVSKLPSIDSSGISLGSLDESHICLVSQTWKFGEDKVAARMICNMIANLPSLLFTLPEHRGKGYAKVLVSNMAKRLHTQVYPVYCFIKEENVVSYSLFKYLERRDQGCIVSSHQSQRCYVLSEESDLRL